MQKALLVIAVLALSSSLVACKKKTYYCVCTDRGIILTNTKEIKAENWSEARHECEQNNPSDPNGTTGVYCELQPE
ncbi:MAG: hypothetical protein R2800_01655 [Flavipsychrobacter sp.]